MKKMAAIILSVMMIFCMAGCLDDYGTTSTGSTDNSSKSEVVVSVSTSSQDYFESQIGEVSSKTSSKIETSSKSQTSVISSKTQSSNTSSKVTQNNIVTSSKAPTSDVLVWIPTNGGKKYHSKSSCSNMKNPKQVTKDSAIQQGFGQCGRCW